MVTYIFFSRKGIVLEILNDTHLENAFLYRVTYKSDKMSYAYECCVQNNKLVFNDLCHHKDRRNLYQNK